MKIIRQPPSLVESPIVVLSATQTVSSSLPPPPYRETDPRLLHVKEPDDVRDNNWKQTVEERLLKLEGAKMHWSWQTSRILMLLAAWTVGLFLADLHIAPFSVAAWVGFAVVVLAVFGTVLPKSREYRYDMSMFHSTAKLPEKAKLNQ